MRPKTAVRFPRYDVAVLGAGLGGVVAAVRAAELGQRVLLVEAGRFLGGTAMYSGGGIHVWGATDWDAYRRHCPQADPVLARTLFDAFPSLVRWLEQIGGPGAYVTSTNRGLTLSKYQIGDSIAAPGRAAWFRHMARRLRALGGTIELGMRATGLTTAAGRMTGFTAVRDGREIAIACRCVVLAAGGFQNAPALLDRYITSGGTPLLNRGAATNRGDGLRMALAAGAAPSERMDTLYGHLMPAPPCRPRAGNFMDLLLLSAFYAEQAIVVNMRGERFVDEGIGELNGETINAAAAQDGDLWIVMDAEIRARHARYALPGDTLRLANWRHIDLLPYMRLRRSPTERWHIAFDSLRFAARRGARIIRADDRAMLVARLGDVGVDRTGLSATIDAFNHAAAEGRADRLAIPKTRHAFPLRRPPFYAIKVAVGVSMTYGGVRIDPQARVLDHAGVAMTGLYAVPGTAGGIHHLHYAGALASCAVFGKIAAESAAADAVTSPAAREARRGRHRSAAS